MVQRLVTTSRYVTGRVDSSDLQSDETTVSDHVELGTQRGDLLSNSRTASTSRTSACYTVGAAASSASTGVAAPSHKRGVLRGLNQCAVAAPLVCNDIRGSSLTRCRATSGVELDPSQALGQRSHCQ